MEADNVFMIDQNVLPFRFSVICCKKYTDTCNAIVNMTTRGAGSIGAAAGFAMAQACLQAKYENTADFLLKSRQQIESTRPTARNLFYATEKVFNAALISVEQALVMAQKVADECADQGRRIGVNGNALLAAGIRVLTHCNAGWLALVDYGSALAPIYEAHSCLKKPFVYVDETRPRGQGARLTAWELFHQGIDHKIIPDNAAAHFMSQGAIDICIVGADRIAHNGDTANKIGTLEKALAAKYYNIPFYVAAPSSTYDKDCSNGSEIVIEYRTMDEVLFLNGYDAEGYARRVVVANPGSEALNPAFDVTPAGLITGFITEDGIFTPQELETKYAR